MLDDPHLHHSGDAATRSSTDATPTSAIATVPTPTVATVATPAPMIASSKSVLNPSPQGLPNRQRLSELPHALLHADRLTDLAHFLCDLRVIECFFEAGRGYAEQLLVLYDEAITRIAAHSNGGNSIGSNGSGDNRSGGNSSGGMAGVNNLLKSFFLFVSRWFHVLCLEPSLLPSLASNAPQTSPVTAAAASLISAPSAPGVDCPPMPRPFLQWLNRPLIADACVQTNLFTHRVNTGALSSDAQVCVL